MTTLPTNDETLPDANALSNVLNDVLNDEFNENDDFNDDTLDDTNDDANVDVLCPAELNYNVKGYQKPILFVMCIGLKDSSGSPLIDLATTPWSKLKKQEIKPSHKDHTDEILRRSTPTKTSRCSNWRLSKCIDWLKDNPISFEDDIRFLVSECNRFRGTIEDAATEERQGPGGGSWRGSVPYLRLILCLIEDDIKAKYLRRGDTLSRQELDGRNSEQRDPTVYEMIADRWNSTNFNPILPASTVHSDFRTAVDCSFHEVSTLQEATSSKVQNALSSMRADLIRIIQNWEKSGQGDSGVPSSDDDGSTSSGPSAGNTSTFGQLNNRSAAALDTRANFLNGRPPYLLILWELADSHHLLASTVQRLDNSTSAVDAGSTPSVVHMRRRRPSPVSSIRSSGGQELEDALQNFVSEFRSIQQSSDDTRSSVEIRRECNTRISSLRDKQRDYRMLKFRSSDPSEIEFIDSELEKIDAEIEEWNRERREMQRQH
jgi:hypothetical protein